jgi:hypothetical protein
MILLKAVLLFGAIIYGIELIVNLVQKTKVKEQTTLLFAAALVVFLTLSGYLGV